MPPRSANAVTNQYTVCAGYDADELLAVLDNSPGAAVVFIRTLIGRLCDANRGMTAGGL
jgi:CRP-like cAMP-binding protein